MAWEARSGLKRKISGCMLKDAYRLNGLGSPFGIETGNIGVSQCNTTVRLNGLGSPFGIETFVLRPSRLDVLPAKWPGKPVRD